MFQTSSTFQAVRRLITTALSVPLPGPRYTVQPGDTLSGIAARLGTTVAALMQANPQIEDADRLNAGQALALPPGAELPPPIPATHLVRPGDTLWQLARDHHTSVHALARLNGIANPDRLRVGERLALPAAIASAPSPADTRPWMVIARAEQGQREIAGPRDNPRIVAYHQTTRLRAHNDETPWCSSFVNWVLTQAGFRGTGSAAAISWATWGQRVPGLDQGRPGDIVVLHRHGAPSSSNHVGFLVHSENGQVRLLGGNQGNQVKESNYNLQQWEVVAVRRPQ